MRVRNRRGASADLLVVGLGNPGKKYDQTRHNVGADAVAVFAEHHGSALSNDRRRRAQTCELDLHDRQVILACPTTFMNESGSAVRALIDRYGISDPLSLVVVYDELDLAVGRLKLKLGGGTAGHNGLESIASHIKSLDFLRLRIGIGKPATPLPGAAWVLKRPSAAERDLLNATIAKTTVALDTLVSRGVEVAMNIANAP